VKTKIVFKVQKRPSDGLAALRPRVVDEAGKLFLARGFVGVTSDEIASRLGISKATLYKAFPGKEAILREVVRGHMAEIQTGVERLIADGSLGFVEKMVALLSFLRARLSRFGPVLVRDLRRSAPGLWQEIEDFRRDKILENFKVILEDGRREGCFREDVDPGLLLAMFLDLIQHFVNPDAILRTGRSPAETFGSVVKVFFQGILTDRGRKGFSAPIPALFESGKEILS
jgi:TetR/AcrR family transcriptional regulator, cholesterol catabolism regulator